MCGIGLFGVINVFMVVFDKRDVLIVGICLNVIFVVVVCCVICVSLLGCWLRFSIYVINFVIVFSLFNWLWFYILVLRFINSNLYLNIV